MPHPLLDAFEERRLEVDAYLKLLEAIEAETASGPPRLATTSYTITTQQQKILYSGVFLQLYNLVEATVARCLDHVTGAAIVGAAWQPHQLTVKFRTEWARVVAKTHADLSYENRLVHVLELIDKFVASLPVDQFALDKGGGGNWDDKAIERVAKRIGMSLNVPRSARANIQYKFKNDLTCLTLIMKSRNWLAHGNISFEDASSGLAVAQLRSLADRTLAYMRGVVSSFIQFADNHEFLMPTERPSSTHLSPPP